MNEDDRQEKLALLAECKAMSEKAYDDMYEARSARVALDRYREAKDCLYAAIAHARDLGLSVEADALSNRLAHIKAVVRSQFV
jgi:hypothetical protein